MLSQITKFFSETVNTEQSPVISLPLNGYARGSPSRRSFFGFRVKTMRLSWGSVTTQQVGAE